MSWKEPTEAQRKWRARKAGSASAKSEVDRRSAGEADRRLDDVLGKAESLSAYTDCIRACRGLEHKP